MFICFVNLVAVWDFDEFLIPVGKFRNVIDLLSDIESPTPISYDNPNLLKFNKTNWKGGKGLADVHAHPFCYIRLNSKSVLADKRTRWASQQTWLGQKMAHRPEQTFFMTWFKSIWPTRTVYHGGLHEAGVCKLPIEWTSCKDNNQTEYCYGTKDKHNDIFSRFHDFNQNTGEKNGKLLDMDTQAYIAHFQYRRYLYFTAKNESLSQEGPYSRYYFRNIHETLYQRGLVMPFEWNVSRINKLIARNNRDARFISFAPDQLNITSKGVKHHNNNNNNIKTFPVFAADKSELFLSAMIERVDDSWDLYLTTFMMNHNTLNNLSSISIRNDNHVVAEWSEAYAMFRTTKYHQDGKRLHTPTYFCKISHKLSDSPTYIVAGEFMPTVSLSAESNSYSQLDILRCKMENTQDAFLSLAGGSENLLVEIMRAVDYSNVTTPEAVHYHHLIRFSVSWETRMQNDHHHSTQRLHNNHPSQNRMSNLTASYQHPKLSVFNPWLGFDKNNIGKWSRAPIVMCSTDWDNVFDSTKV